LFNEHNGTRSMVVCVITLFTLSLFFFFPASSVSLSLLVIVLSHHLDFHHPLPWYLLHSFHLCLHIFPMFSRCPLLSCSELDIQEKDDFFFYTSFSCVHHVLNASSSTHLLFQLFCLKRKSWTGIHDCNSWREKYKEEERGILKLAVNTPALYLQKLYRVAYCITWNIAYR